MSNAFDVTQPFEYTQPPHRLLDLGPALLLPDDTYSYPTIRKSWIARAGYESFSELPFCLLILFVT